MNIRRMVSSENVLGWACLRFHRSRTCQPRNAAGYAEIPSLHDSLRLSYYHSRSKLTHGGVSYQSLINSMLKPRLVYKNYYTI